jgi:HPr kinase/phosphorylase
MPRSNRPQFVTVGDFFQRHHRKLSMRLIGSDKGFSKKIKEPTINRPGLALAGFFKYFAYRRAQVLGNSEFSYMTSLTSEQRRKHFGDLCARNFPCLIVARGKTPESDLLEIAENANISVLQTKMISMKFINAATLKLEQDFAPTTTEHGCMVDVRGIGILIKGASGTGKSEIVLGLIDRGASLVADDSVRLRAPEGQELTGTSSELGRFHMEVRGMGIINVPKMFGAGAMRVSKRLDLIVKLTHAGELNELDRVGIKREFHTVLGRRVPIIQLAVAPGRDMAHLVEVAALDQKLKSFGHDSALEFNKKLLKFMSDKTIS